MIKQKKQIYNRNLIKKQIKMYNNIKLINNNKITKITINLQKSNNINNNYNFFNSNNNKFNNN